ncbi:hypothetical protein AC1031_019294 [Aphanomyces cochlioides]|nr:hypothetical protein AC1031_019294 [Aphanomyces cochlioides]
MAATAVLQVFQCQSLMNLVSTFQPGLPQDMFAFRGLQVPEMPSPTRRLFLFQIDFASLDIVLAPWYRVYGTDRLKKLLALMPHVHDVFFMHAVFQGSFEAATELAQPKRLLVEHHVLDIAAMNGHVDLFCLLQHWNYNVCTCRAMDWAAAGGHLEMVQYLHNGRREGCTKDAMEFAARNGHLTTVQWLHCNRSEGCSKRAMDFAAAQGHLDVVIWLATHRREGCSTLAMDWAAKNGHLKVVQWLHDNRNEGCTTGAMTLAAGWGHLHIVRWLFENRYERCKQKAIIGAAKHGRLNVVVWLHRTMGLKCTAKVLKVARSGFHSEIIDYVQKHLVGASMWGE